MAFYVAALFTLSSARKLSGDEMLALYGEQPPLTTLLHDPASPPTATLRGAAAGRLLMGAESAFYYFSDPPYQPTLYAQYDFTEPENECKMDWTEPSRGVFDIQNCSSTATAMRVQGAGRSRSCCIVWGAMAQPDWFAKNPNWTAAELTSILQVHTNGTMGSDLLRGQFLAWDVVNEPISDHGGTFKGNTWWPTMGDEYIDTALKFARAADPAAQLFINDYGGEGAGYPKSEKMYALVKDILARGTPLDGVGLQLHVSYNAYPPPATVAANIARLGALGLKVHITEFDVTCPPAHCNASDPASPGFVAQAALYGQMLQACLNNSGVCTAFNTWGFTDKYSWETWCGKNPGCQALPFDHNYTAKAAVNEMVAVLEGHARRAA